MRRGVNHSNVPGRFPDIRHFESKAVGEWKNIRMFLPHEVLTCPQMES